MAAATQPQTTQASQLAAIQRRLDKWELTHLRALAADLAERLDRTEHELVMERRRAAAAEDAADMWRDQANELVDDLNALGRTVGLTQTGHLVTMPMPGVDIAHVHTRTMASTDNGYAVREGGAA